MIIAVDGPAASGKGTLAKRLAAKYGLSHLDTGRTYRAVAAALLAAGKPAEDEEAALGFARDADFSRLDDPALGDPAVGEMASRIAVNPALREFLVERQREFAAVAMSARGGAVLDGRDIGTVVCPDAPLKLYIVASVEERARRRALEAYGVAEGPDYDAMLSALQARDARDMAREASPLRPAEDAHHIDTTEMSPDGVLETAARLVENIRNR